MEKSGFILLQELLPEALNRLHETVKDRRIRQLIEEMQDEKWNKRKTSK